LLFLSHGTLRNCFAPLLTGASPAELPFHRARR
jgi:hypothetical protein